MTVLFALVPSLIAIVIFVGTFRLQAPQSETRAQRRPRPVHVTSAKPLRTPLPVAGAARRAARPGAELRA